MPISPNQLLAALNRFEIRSFETTDEKRRTPRRWWVIDTAKTTPLPIGLSGGDYAEGYTVVGAPDGYASYDDAQLARVDAALKSLNLRPGETVYLPAAALLRDDEGGGP